MDTLKLWPVFLILLWTHALKAQEETILWQPELRLRWSDFKAEPPKSKRIAATTASGISYQYNARGRDGRYRLNFQVDTYFYPRKSWYHPELCDSVTLSHEQLHFDISELFARKFRRRLEDRDFSENVKAEVRAIFREVNEALSAFQERYDRETDFSRNRQAQREWNQRVGQMLRR